MNKKRGQPGAFFLAFLVASVFVILISHTCPGFRGTDSQGPELIASISPGYTPWCKTVGYSPDRGQEILLFALQAGLGAGVLAYGFTLFNRKKTGDDT